MLFRSYKNWQLNTFKCLELLQCSSKSFKSSLYFITVSTSGVVRTKFWRLSLKSKEQPLINSENGYRNKMLDSIKIIINSIEKVAKQKITYIKACYKINYKENDEPEAWLVGCEGITFTNRRMVNIEAHNKKNPWISLIKENDKRENNSSSILKSSIKSFPVKWENFRKAWCCNRTLSRNNKTKKLCKSSYKSLNKTNKHKGNGKLSSDDFGNEFKADKMKIVCIGQQANSINNSSRNNGNIQSKTHEAELFGFKHKNHESKSQTIISPDNNTPKNESKHNSELKDYTDIICHGKGVRFNSILRKNYSKQTNYFSSTSYRVFELKNLSESRSNRPGSQDSLIRKREEQNAFKKPVFHIKITKGKHMKNNTVKINKPIDVNSISFS